MKSIKKQIGKIETKNKKQTDDLLQQIKELYKSLVEMRKQQQESTKKLDKTNDSLEKLREEMIEQRIHTGGISDSNGRFAEHYFYASLSKYNVYAGVCFDEIVKNRKKAVKSKDGTIRQGEYDIYMYNGDSIALIEVKYRVRKRDVTDLINRRINNFKNLYPEYSNYKFYLGVAGMSIDDDVTEEALNKGVGVLRFRNNDIEILDENLKIF